MRRRLGALAAIALVAAAAAGCSSSPSDDAVCVDQRTGVRVDDDQCDRSVSPSYVWWFYPHGHAPAVGVRAPGGAAALPKGRTAVRVRPRPAPVRPAAPRVVVRGK